MCERCRLPMAARQDDGMGQHIECPPTPDREAYLRLKHKRDPRSVAWNDALKEGREPWKER